MNYRHHFHAGNFADAFKHALLIQLVRAMQRKAGGVLFLDTHAGAGGYELAQAAAGPSQARAPEYPDGIGRLWAAAGLPPALEEYVGLVREYQRVKRLSEGTLGVYPGSPWFLRRLARGQDRLAWYEIEASAFANLRKEAGGRRVLSQKSDGYGGMAALLPPPEKRALVLIDPPYETPEEWAGVRAALRTGLKRLPAGLYAVWYPLTARAGKADEWDRLCDLSLPPTLAIELRTGAEGPGLTGCGLLIVNPPWRFDAGAEPWLRDLARILGRGPEAGAELRWLVPE